MLDIIIKTIKDYQAGYPNLCPILVFGNGGSASDASHFVAELMGRYSKEDKVGPMMAFNLTADNSVVTAIANDFGYENVFSHQIKAFQMSKVLIGISTSGSSLNVLNGLRAASKHDFTVLLTSSLYKDDGEFDSVVSVDSIITREIQEEHIKILHNLAEGLKC